MSMLSMDASEERALDAKMEQLQEWASTRQAEAEQLAQDSTRLLACVGDRMERLSKQNFFLRCWSRFKGDAAAAERANSHDLIQMQKIAFRYVSMLQEQQILMAHALLSLKNNLYSLAIKETATRNLINELAKRTLRRFESLEGRVEQVEISTNLQGWLLGLEERDYDEKYPTQYMRLFRVINDFYHIKNDNWNYNDLIFMRKAIRKVGIDPKAKLSLNKLIDNLVDEILDDQIGFSAYSAMLSEFEPNVIKNYSKFVVDNVSSPVFSTLHGLHIQFTDKLDVVEDLQDDLTISQSEALKKLLRLSIGRMNINLDYEFPLAEAAIEILGCLRLVEKLHRQATADAQSAFAGSGVVSSESPQAGGGSGAALADDDAELLEENAVSMEDEGLSGELKEEISQILLDAERIPENARLNFYVKDKLSSSLNDNLKYSFRSISGELSADDILLISETCFDHRIAFLADRMIIKNSDGERTIFYEDISDVYVNEDELGDITLTIELEEEEIIIGTWDANHVYSLLRILEEILTLIDDDFRMSADMVDYLIKMNLRAQYYTDSSLYVKDYNTDGFDKKINNAIKKFNIYLHKDAILAYYDNTLFGGGDEGFILTKDHIYYRNSLSDPVSVEYASIYKVEATKGGFEVNGKQVNCSGDSTALGVVNALDAIIKNKKHLLE